MTQIIKSLSDWQILRQEMSGAIGFVPTMGNLHDGHKSLLRRSIQENQQTVLSIFVNPTQFDDVKDFENYPKTLDVDIIEAEKLGVDWILIPATEDMYPDNYRYHVVETTGRVGKASHSEACPPRSESLSLSHQLCGAHRPGHFEGMLTIVLKWLLLVKPTCAYFGEKDFQQLALVREMVRAFFLDVDIIPCETVRDKNGLALSSRNARLSSESYALAIQFPKWLQSVLSLQEIRMKLEQLGMVVEYIEEYQGRRFGAVQVGGVRLIDNFPLTPLPRAGEG